jgi:Xaa-Pro aminopeptidase
LIARLDDLEVEAFFVTRLPNVRYLSGFSGSNGQILLSEREGIFLTDGRYTEQSRREVPELERRTYRTDLPAEFVDACSALGATKVAFESDGMTYQEWSRLAKAGEEAGGIQLVPAQGAVEALRWVKDPEELALVAAAQAVTDEGYDVITRKLVEGISEKEAAFELDSAMHRAGADGLAFETIMAFGENAAEPHHSPTERQLARGELVKMDFGAQVGGYHSDMTRTVAFGEVSDRLREVYQVVLLAQQAGIDAVRPGATGGECDEAARAVIREAGHVEAFKHSLGHGVGLEIHEPPWLRASGEQVLPEGTIVTVEPGIYLDGEGGVRIEDMVQVTADGCRPLPRSPRELVVL